MRKTFLRILILAIITAGGFLWASNNALADEPNNHATDQPTTPPVSISPASRVLQLDANTVYNGSFRITNNSDNEAELKIYAAPYAYVYSEDDSSYQLSFAHENNYTKIAQWVTFKDANGNYTATTNFTILPHDGLMVDYKITTPTELPSGGQYAIIFAQNASDDALPDITGDEPGHLLIYGRTTSDATTIAAISSLSIDKTLSHGEETENFINATAKVKNTGNSDFIASGKLTVQGLFGQVYYETPNTKGRISVLPDSELVVSDRWLETPYFGIFKVTWTVAAAGESETASKIVLILPLPIIIAAISLLLAIAVWLVIMIKKRKNTASVTEAVS